MESERREHDTFIMSRLSNVNSPRFLTTSKFACLKDFLLHSGLVSEVASKFFTTTLKSKLNSHSARLVSVIISRSSTLQSI